MKRDKILLDHGSGGKLSNDLVSELILPVFNNPELSRLGDGAIVDIGGARIAMSTDSYVVDPIFFPGGSIGDLAVNGTVNDIAMCGAIPLYLSAGLIIEEGFDTEELKRIIADMGRAAKKAGVTIITGDTKVVPKGAADKVFINTSGIGLVKPGVNIGGAMAQPGDKIIVSGTIADHGMTILTQREELTFDSDIKSDSAALNHMVNSILDISNQIHVMRDPTRGGVATSLNEIAGQSNVGIRLYEENIPVKNNVASLCELLGFDPLYVANEGKMIVFVAAKDADAVLTKMRKEPLGADAAIIGEVVTDHEKKVILNTRIGGERIVPILTGEQFPRIC